ncbi:transcriptional regulator, DeoR family [Thermocrinis albus DSM 14484]|uniref:Transcriptional regulator, DeoR family n=1 Tax=Thermocrinis albus (strain DSM 14484 / JCM 11386 / HI 11/12) TaxID=638303 RepID=D3SNI7_THEAH|nr:DeoR family transcriptional regulator [Thermocrinis albus]ADC88724.1 transcriptional regulator, DeoR family [Thermocrinis albus DSM 14484]
MGRKERILQLIEEGHTNVKSLAQKLGVSLMTVYRDIKELELEGRVVRKHGEVRLKEEQDDGHCSFCGKSVENRLEMVYRVGGRRIRACCAHCGLLLYRELEGKDILACMTKDFITGKLINCFTAWYVVGSSAEVCCSPSALAFERIEDARRFAKGFGGRVLNFEGAVKAVEEIMKRGTPVQLKL